MMQIEKRIGTIEVIVLRIVLFVVFLLEIVKFVLHVVQDLSPAVRSLLH